MPQKRKNEYSVEDLKSYMALPVRDKLRLIEQMNRFFNRFMPAKSKKIWKKLQQKGF